MVATNAISSNVWHYLVATYSGTSTVAGMKIYVDGVSQPLSTLSDTLTVSIINTAVPATFNGRGGATNMSSDAFDEVRVSAKGIVLAPDWIIASYNNQRSPGTFFAVTTGLTNGAASAPIVSLSTAALAFGTQTTNTTSSAQSVTVTNNGPGALTISSLAITGTEERGVGKKSRSRRTPSP